MSMMRKRKAFIKHLVKSHRNKLSRFVMLLKSRRISILFDYLISKISGTEGWIFFWKFRYRIIWSYFVARSATRFWPIYTWLKNEHHSLYLSSFEYFSNSVHDVNFVVKSESRIGCYKDLWWRTVHIYVKRFLLDSMKFLKKRNAPCFIIMILLDSFIRKWMITK